MSLQRLPDHRDGAHKPAGEAPRMEAPAQDERIRRLASAMGNQAFSRQVLARDHKAGFGKSGTVIPPDPAPAHPQPGFGHDPHAVDPSRFHDEPPEPQLPGSAYGPLPFPVPSGIPNRSDLNYFTTRALEADAAVRPEYAALVKQMAGGEGNAKRFVGANESLEKEIGANPNEKATVRAIALEQQQAIFHNSETIAKLIEVDLEEARAKLESAEMRLEGVREVSEARHLADEAAEVKEAAEKTLERVKPGWELAKAAMEFEPIEAAKALYELFGKAIAVKATAAERLGKESKAKYASGENKLMAAAWDDIDAANAKLDALGKVAGEEQETLAKHIPEMERLRDQAEGAYDKSTHGKFRFGALRGQLDWAGKTIDHAARVLHLFDVALEQSRLLKSAYERTVDDMLKADTDPTSQRPALATATKMVAGQEDQRRDAEAAQQRATALKDQLGTLRARGDAALAKGD